MISEPRNNILRRISVVMTIQGACGLILTSAHVTRMARVQHVRMHGSRTSGHEANLVVVFLQLAVLLIAQSFDGPLCARAGATACIRCVLVFVGMRLSHFLSICVRVL
jgi:hypothetical protein